MGTVTGMDDAKTPAPALVPEEEGYAIMAVEYADEADERRALARRRLLVWADEQ